MARSTAASFGAADLCFVVLPHPMGGIKREAIRAQADNAFEAVVRAAVDWRPSAAQMASRRGAYPSEHFTFQGSLDDVIALYSGNGWSDGLPIIPPTPDRVAAMLKGTHRSPDTVIGTVPPRMGMLTVELAAVHAVMAGARPEHFPLILAAADALLDPRHDFRSATTTTNPCAIFILVTGPAVQEIGVQYAEGALAPGPFSGPNATVGRAINLIMDVVGGSKPPSPDKSTLGSPASYTMVLGENVDATPWKTVNEQLGFDRDANLVTVFEMRSFVNFNLHNPNTAEGLLDPMAATIGPVAGLAENAFECGRGPAKVLALSPEHAATIAGEGWTEADVKAYLHEHASISMERYLVRNNGVEPDCRQDEAEPSVLAEPGNVLVVVAGGPGKHSVYLETTRYAPVSKSLEAWR
ncbi:thiol-disulfide oxidoreductase [Limnochorda pilosa]|uniref:Thiol-disulfide oxidoreductase n=1 Tax=Limnochorda pilosa TaxID=1555112 RepID=A0A0K2SHD2_LIMPI|nr:hypothetical protein [Limnochorda pilosa]BAS26219.1 thiol-disulfide oxidoreductase [Limnochorda pilosa]